MLYNYGIVLAGTFILFLKFINIIINIMHNVNIKNMDMKLN